MLLIFGLGYFSGLSISTVVFYFSLKIEDKKEKEFKKQIEKRISKLEIKEDERATKEKVNRFFPRPAISEVE